MVPEPTVRATRYTLGDPADETAQIHLWTDDGHVWHVTDYYGSWLDERGRWDWPPRTAQTLRNRRQQRARRAKNGSPS